MKSDNDKVNYFSGGLCLGLVFCIIIILIFTFNSEPNNVLIERGYKQYHPTTGDLIWKEDK